jgi:hypothetical protein
MRKEVAQKLLGHAQKSILTINIHRKELIDFNEDCQTRKSLAFKLQNPRLKQIRLHTFRHWKATMEYHKTRDILHVQQVLGHRDLRNTLVYINLEKALFQNTDDEYHVKVAQTLEEATKLLEVGFEYVTDMDGAKIFKKRK